MTLVIGTRGSALARVQADGVAALLRAAEPDLDVRVEIIVTAGDRLPSGALADAGGKALWIDEIEDALLAGRVDLAVHSLKDVPAALAPGLVLAAVPRRADPRDAVVSRDGFDLGALPAGARVGTSSLRRVCQLVALRPDLDVVPLRGNVDTRLGKIASGAVDAAVLAAAGLDRLGHGGRIRERLAPERMLPAIGQGALALEARASDARTLALASRLADRDAGLAAAAERALLAGLGAGCRTPVAGHAEVGGGRVRLRGLVGRPDGSQILRADLEAGAADAAGLGARVAAALLAAGADAILADLG